jgi:hypothetical protein
MFSYIVRAEVGADFADAPMSGGRGSWALAQGYESQARCENIAPRSQETW